jgi:predicted nucleic acid-binding protein
VTPLVVDASALVEYLFGTPAGRRLAPMLEQREAWLNVPALCDLEVAAAVRRALAGRRMSTARATIAVRDYLDLPLTRHGHAGLLSRVLELRHNFSMYDAAYVVLAERLDATLVTADGALRAQVTRSRIVAVAPSED